MKLNRCLNSYKMIHKRIKQTKPNSQNTPINQIVPYQVTKILHKRSLSRFAKGMFLEKHSTQKDALELPRESLETQNQQKCKFYRQVEKNLTKLYIRYYHYQQVM